MLADLVAFGIIPVSGGSVEPGTGTVDVPAGATVVITPATGGGSASGLPVGAFQWPRPLDPSDRTPYAFGWASLLEDDETIADVEKITISALGASLGVMVDSDPERLPMIDAAAKKVSLWFLVSPSFQTNAAFANAGSQVGVSMLIRTDAAPYREYERTAILTVRQQ